ncbi:MAG: hypothetical protein LUF32_09140 [Clostridiales bacterium]|nr:hypothetical protein [Clostridiales bacterium]
MNKLKILSVCIAVLLVATASGCQIDSGQAESDGMSAPGALAAAEPVDGSENLSEIHADFLADEPYSAALRLGDYLLLIRMSIAGSEDQAADTGNTDVSDAVDNDAGIDDSDAADNDEETDDSDAAGNEETDNSDGADNDETDESDAGEIYSLENFAYQLDLYSPEENAIIAGLNTEDLSADFYQVVGSELFLTDTEAGVVYRYDETLSLLDTYDVSSFADDFDGYFYAADEEDSWYLINDEEHATQKASFAEDEWSLTDCGTGDYYCSSIQTASPDTTKLLISTIDAQDFHSESQVLDTADLGTIRSYSTESFSSEKISDDAFLARLSEGTDPYLYDRFDGTPVYFAAPADGSVSLMGSGILVTRNSLFGDDGTDSAYSACLYNSDGDCVSSMRYAEDRDGDGETDTFVFSDPIYFEAYNCALLLTWNEENGTCLLVWDLGTAGEGADSLTFYTSAEEVPEAADSASSDTEDGAGGDSETDEGESGETETDAGDDPEADGTTVTRISDRDSYDWGALSDARSHADALEEAFGISIYLGPEIPSYIGNYGAAQCLDADTLENALELLEGILSLYPENFFSQLLYDDLRGIRIYLTGTLTGDSEGLLENPGGYVEDINHYVVMTLDAEQYENWDYTVNHEISHMIDRSLTFRSLYRKDALFSEEGWAAYNPTDFVYSETYDGYGENTNWPALQDYFIDAYGMTFATEDRAEIFGNAMSDFMNGGSSENDFGEGSILQSKLAYYCACIRDGFDTTGWEEVMPWEQDCE